MSEKTAFAHQVRRTAVVTMAFVAALGFGIILLADGDWIPGAIIVVAALIALVAQVPAIRRLRSGGPPGSPPKGKPAH